LYIASNSGVDPTVNSNIIASSLNPNTGQLSEPVNVTPSNYVRPILTTPQAPPVSASSGKYLYFAGYDQPDFQDAIFLTLPAQNVSLSELL